MPFDGMVKFTSHCGCQPGAPMDVLGAEVSSKNKRAREALLKI